MHDHLEWFARHAIGGVGQAGSVGDNNDGNTATVTGDGFAVAAVGTINIDGLTAIAGAGQTVTVP